MGKLLIMFIWIILNSSSFSLEVFKYYKLKKVIQYLTFQIVWVRTKRISIYEILKVEKTLKWNIDRGVFISFLFLEVINVIICYGLIRVIKGSLHNSSFKSLSGKIFVSLGNSKSWNVEFKIERVGFDYLENSNVFDWQLEHMYGTLWFVVSRSCELFRLVQLLWHRAWQVLHKTWCCFCFTFVLLLQQLQRTFVTDDVKFKQLLA